VVRLWLGGWSAGAGEQLFPAVLPWPVPWQVQGQPPGGGGDPGWDGDQVSADGGGGGFGVEHRCDCAGGGGQVERDRTSMLGAAFFSKRKLGLFFPTLIVCGGRSPVSASAIGGLAGLQSNNVGSRTGGVTKLLHLPVELIPGLGIRKGDVSTVPCVVDSAAPEARRPHPGDAHLGTWCTWDAAPRGRGPRHVPPRLCVRLRAVVKPRHRGSPGPASQPSRP